MAIELLAPAKVNLTLEVLGRRPDGYHEIASVIQTIGLVDRVVVEPAATLELRVTGDEVAYVPAGVENLAYRAALALMEEMPIVGHLRRRGRKMYELPGARITLEKRIPAGAGLGGGSSDAAAVLRGLDRLWSLGLGAEELSRLAARLGSDVAFFLHGGTAVVSGRGEVVRPLPDHPPHALTLLLSDARIEDKTRRMYSMVSVSDYSDGASSEAGADGVRSGRGLEDRDLTNVFDRHVAAAAPVSGRAIGACRTAGVEVHAAGSGPALFAWRAQEDLPKALVSELRALGVRTMGCETLRREEAFRVFEN